MTGDDADDDDLVAAHLRSDGSFALVHVETLAAACNALLGGDRADTVILDLNLPDSAGL